MDRLIICTYSKSLPTVFATTVRDIVVIHYGYRPIDGSRCALPTPNTGPDRSKKSDLKAVIIVSIVSSVGSFGE